MDCQTTTFTSLQARLLRLINLRIDNGEFTERGLARLIGISQPQVHNVLKGKRKLQVQLADRIMHKFDITVLDLLYETELREQLATRINVQARDIWNPIAPSKKSGTGSTAYLRKPSGRAATRRPSAQDLAS